MPWATSQALKSAYVYVCFDAYISGHSFSAFVNYSDTIGIKVAPEQHGPITVNSFKGD